MRILIYPQDTKLLREVAQSVTAEMRNSDDFKSKLIEMTEIAKKDGIGLAATQVGWNVNLFLLLVNRNLEKLLEPIVVINPRIISESEETAKAGEGCLSFPSLEVKVTRPTKITWEAEDLEGIKTQAEETYMPKSLPGYFIRVIQHETDHLNGRLMVDHLSAAEHLRFEKWLKKREHDATH